MTKSAETRIPRRRWTIGGLLGVGVLINYFVRIIFYVASTHLQYELCIS
jgi:ACS family D-galactonate transporter-like MFS transporter